MDGNQIVQSYRHCLRSSVGALLVETGFDSCDKLALESMTELLQSFIKELGRSSRAFCELACRTEVLGADVMLALSEMGYPPLGVKEYALRVNRKTVGAPIPANPPKQTSILHTGDRKRPPKSFGIPEGLPDFPDSHSFIRTPTHKQPQADYESVREKAASQKRDVERALSKFIAKTCGKTHSLFATDETNLFPLISCSDNTVHAEFNTNFGAESVGETTVQVPAYVNALLFRDQIFEEDEREYPQPKKVVRVEEPDKRKIRIVEAKYEHIVDEETKDAIEEEEDKDTSRTEEYKPHENPFMRPVRLPRNALCLPPACK